MYTTWFKGHWSDGNTPLVGAMDHGVWLASTVFDGARSIHRMAPVLRAHCQRTFDSAERVGLSCTSAMTIGFTHLGGVAQIYRLPAFAHGAAALVLDAHFTPDELRAHRGWGHSDWRQCEEFAASVDAGGLWLFHHKPGRTDEALVRIRLDAQRVFRATETASEGEALQL